MLRILLAVTALLIYGSLYPWRFHAGLSPGGPVNALLHSWQLSFNRFFLRDVALNIAIYVPFGVTAYLWLSSRPALVRFALPVLLAGTLSTSIELAQFYAAHRFTSLVDVATNMAGAALGMILGIPLARRRVRSAYAINMPEPGALLLTGCWVGAMLFPLIPDFSRTQLHEKLSAFFLGGFSFVGLFGLLAMWLAAARLLFGLLAEGSTAVVFPLLGLVLPARFLIVGLSSGWIYWAAFAAAWFLWTVLFSDARRPDAVLAAIVIASIVLTGLSPFRFSEVAQDFNWVPFRALFSTNWETGFALFLNKAFLYGSAIWLLQQAGMRLRKAAIVIAACLATIEALQVFLPSHTAEITDPLLSVLIAWILHRLSRAVAHSTYDEPGPAFGYRARQDSAASHKL